MNLTTSPKEMSIEFGGRRVFADSAEHPFLTALTEQVAYKSSHGNFSVKCKTLARVPLRFVESVANGTDEMTATFAAEGMRVTVSFEHTEHALKMRFSPEGITALEIRLCAVPDEGIFGGGEQFRQLNMKGERIVNLVSEHIVVPPIVQKLLLKNLYREKKHSYIETYAPMTTYVSSEKYALRFDVDAYGVADFSKAEHSVFRFSECPRTLLFVTGDTLADVGRALNEDIPNREHLPDWCYDGMILGVQGGIDRAEQKAREMRTAGARVCAVWCQDWSGKKITAAGKQVYWNWSVDETLYPDLRERVAALKADGIHFLAYINPYLVKDGTLYNFCRDKGYLITREDGSVYHVKSTTFDAGMLDLTNHEAVTYIQETLIKQNMLDLGIDGYMADFGEYLPMDCKLKCGDPVKLHNAWPTIWARINREAVESHARHDEIMFFTRSAYNGAQAQTTIMWNGDQHTDFTRDYGMGCVMPATFNLGFSGMTAVHSDIGGFISFASLARDPELFVRWMEMNAFSPLMRSHETIRPEANTQPYDEEILLDSARLSCLHVELKPYLQKCMREANEGIPAMRPDFYDASDFSLHKDAYSYLLGSDVYVCPVVKRGAINRTLTLPAGNWTQFFTLKPCEGGKETSVPAPLGTPVAFFRTDSEFAELFKSIELVK